DLGDRSGRHLVGDDVLAGVPGSARAARQLHLPEGPGHPAQRGGGRTLPGGLGRSTGSHRRAQPHPDARQGAGRSQDRAGEDEDRQAGHGGAQERVRRRDHVRHARRHDRHHARADRARHRPGDGTQGPAGREEAAAHRPPEPGQERRPPLLRRSELRDGQALPRHPAPHSAPAARPLHRTRRRTQPLQRRGAPERHRGAAAYPGRAGAAHTRPGRGVDPAAHAAQAGDGGRPMSVPAAPGAGDGARPSPLLTRTRHALARATEVYRGTEAGERLVELAQRLDEPLRVAIAGRIKAGKSTLLNALVGEQLAPTDAGECTRIVTWYRDGHTYRVTARLPDGDSRQLKFQREDKAIEIDLGGLTPEQVSELEVTWPSQALRTATLIDTPGIGSLSEQVARRTWDLLAAEDEETP